MLQGLIGNDHPSFPLNTDDIEHIFSVFLIHSF